MNINYNKVNQSNDNFSIENLSIKIKDKVLFDNTDFSIKLDKTYGLIGANGTGKTTLFNFIKEKIETSCIFVSQEFDFNEYNNIVDYVFSSNEKLFSLKKRFDELENDIDNNLDEYNEISDELYSLNYDKEFSIIKSILNGMGFEDLDIDINILSGGWKMRLNLAKALYMKPKLLLLDEPTNHLDLYSVMWLIDYINELEIGIIVISHNIGFLNNITDYIYNIENGKLELYKGNYSSFKKNFNNKITTWKKDYDKYIKKLKLLKKKSKDKKEIDNYIKKNFIEEPPKKSNVRLNFINPNLYKSHLIKVDNLKIQFDDKIILEDITFGLNQDDRICLIGKNGCGKSSLIKKIINRDDDIFYINNLKIGYYSQHFESLLEDDLTPIEFLKQFVSKNNMIKDEEFTVRNYLGRIRLESKAHNSLIKNLSGGQKARIAFCKLILEQPHFIFLDEPTNHLDIEIIESLIEGINSYEGGLMIITHDIDLIEELECVIWKIENKKIIYNYEI